MYLFCVHEQHITNNFASLHDFRSSFTFDRVCSVHTLFEKKNPFYGIDIGSSTLRIREKKDEKEKYTEKPKTSSLSHLLFLFMFDFSFERP